MSGGYIGEKKQVALYDSYTRAQTDGLLEAQNTAHKNYVDGTLVITPTVDGNITLSDEDALYGRIRIVTGVWSQGWAIIVPNVEKLRIVQNDSTYTATVKTAAGTGVPVVAGQETSTYCDGTNVGYAVRKEFNAAGAAPVFACRAWANFNGTTTPPTIRASGNVSSVTRHGTGEYSGNFATEMPDENYSPSLAASPNYGIRASAAEAIFSGGTWAEAAPTTTVFHFRLADDQGAVFNPKYVTFAIFR